ncbi:MAG: hypothetical protein JWQ07_124 [Ramlibacter sp.]|nr:hypothetical protein [Ramlibacter sp.]
MERPPIEPMFETFYREALSSECIAALRVYEAAGKEVEKSNRGEPYDHMGFLTSLQRLVTHAAAISRYFWPAGKNVLHQARGKYLRDVFQMNDSNALHSRALRNNLEHFDERLDKYFQQPVVGYVIPQIVGPRPVPAPGDPPLHVFMAYFTDEDVLRVLDQEINVGSLVDEIAALQNKLQRISGGRPPTRA